MSVTLYEAINDLYDGIFPAYVIEGETDEEEFTVDVDYTMGIETVHITIPQVLDYYANSDRSSIGMLGDIIGDHRMIADLAQEAFDWFKSVNREQLALEAEKRGMVIDPRGD